VQKEEQMSVATNDTLNRQWIQAFNERDWATEAACRTADYQAHMPGAPGPLDAATWDGFMQAFTTAFPDAQLAIEACFSERDLVATRWTITGTHRGEFQGIPASGRQITMRGIEINRVRDGKIAEHWAQFDQLGVLQQIGALPPAP
jgi:steroid delta-isomerase-like uncharacterized protein